MALITRRRKKVSGIVLVVCVPIVIFMSGLLVGMNLPDVEIDYELGWIHSSLMFEAPTGEVMLAEGACLVKEDVLLLQEEHPGSVVSMLSPVMAPPPPEQQQSF